MYYYYVAQPQDLQHHGILGMHWGIRRYQNRDGSLTSAGKRHYGDQDEELYKKVNQRAKESFQSSRKYKKADKKRTEEADRAQRIATSAKASSEKARKTLKALKDEGEKGKTMRDMYGDEAINDEKYFKDVFGYSIKEAWKSEMDFQSESIKRYESQAKTYTKYNKELMNMDIDSMSASEVSKKAKKTLSKILNEG